MNKIKFDSNGKPILPEKVRTDLIKVKNENLEFSQNNQNSYGIDTLEDAIDGVKRRSESDFISKSQEKKEMEERRPEMTKKKSKNNPDIFFPENPETWKSDEDSLLDELDREK